MAFLDTKHKTVRCTECSEQILRNRELVLNNKTICLGCATEKVLLGSIVWTLIINLIALRKLVLALMIVIALS